MLTASSTTDKKLSSPPGRGWRAEVERWSSGLVMLALGGWLAWRLYDGTLNYYLHPRFNLLVMATGLILTLLGGWCLLRKSQARSGELSGVVLLGLVALIGLMIVPRPLEVASGTANRLTSNPSLAQALQKQDWKDATSLDTAQWSLLDWTAALNDPQRAEKLLGRPVDLVGFVIQPASGDTRYFLLGRYVLVCCTADSTALRLPVVTEQPPSLQEGQWVRIRGILSQGSNGVIAFRASSVEGVDRPAQPYIYP